MKLENISALALIALLGVGSLSSGHLLAQPGSNKQQKQSSSQVAGDDRVRAFHGRHRKNGQEIQPATEMTWSQAQQLLQIKSYYAELSPRQIYVEGKGYLNFVFGSGEINGRTGNARLDSISSIVEIGIKPSSPGKSYLADCTVKGHGPCAGCYFRITGPDGQSEVWPVQDSEWKHLLFTVSAGDTDWYTLKLQSPVTFKSCNITEVP
jgi:hypothetical protein